VKAMPALILVNPISTAQAKDNALRALYSAALWATWRDPHMLQILLASSRGRRRYDLGKHAP